MAENGDLILAGLVFPLREGTARQQRDVQQRQEVRFSGEGKTTVWSALAAVVHLCGQPYAARGLV